MHPKWTTPPGYVTRRFRAMGCEVLVVLPWRQSAAVGTVHDLFDRWDAQLSRFRPDSDLMRLNVLAGHAVRTGPLLRAVLGRALAAADATDGVFDPTLGGDLAALGYSRSFAELPANVDRVLTPPPAAASRRDVRIDASGMVTVPRGVAIDLGGIAKGMAVDAAMAALRSRGVRSALLSAGGDLAVAGTLPDGEPWPVAVDTVWGTETVTVSRGAVATSSTERRRWLTPAGEQHHVLDPRTRRPAAGGVTRVTVHAPSCELAEVAAKVALILGRDEGRAFLERRRFVGLISGPRWSDPVGAWPQPGSGITA